MIPLLLCFKIGQKSAEIYFHFFIRIGNMGNTMKYKNQRLHISSSFFTVNPKTFALLHLTKKSRPISC